jgi:hypothetical protein
VSRYACACEGLLKRRTIFLRRAQQHRHAIEGKAVFREIEHTAGNFHAFAVFTWCGEYKDLIVRHRWGRCIILTENMALKARQGSRTPVPAIEIL